MALAGCSTPADTPKTFPAIRHNEDRDWWIATTRGKTKAGGKAGELVVALVVVGYAPE